MTPPALDPHLSRPVLHRDHGGGLDRAVARYGGMRADWIDLSTGINPTPYPLPPLTQTSWAALPDRGAHDALVAAARAFWALPDTVGVLPAPGASALIARIPALAPAGSVQITSPTYNEHAAAFAAQGWTITAAGTDPDFQPVQARVLVHPNNPDGRLWSASDVTAPLTVIDESFCDVVADKSLASLATRPGVIVLKSFGKFWGLAGLRLGFAIGPHDLINAMAEMLGPWPVSGPALAIGAAALSDLDWADQTRERLRRDTQRLDTLMQARNAHLVGGTDLFRLYDVGDAAAWQTRLAEAQIWSRIFPYSDRYLRLGMPREDQWSRIESAI